MLATVVALMNKAWLITPPSIKEVALMKKRILMLLSVVALLVVMLAMSVAPAFADPVKNDPPGFSCGLNDPNDYKDGGEFDEGEPGAGELGKVPENNPIVFGCAPGK
jgi:hypothetical protein